MATVYIDTSALGRVLLGEPDAAAVLRGLAAFDVRVASRLLRLELRRLALRAGLLADADRLLGGIALLPIDEELLASAETVEPAGMATLDAIHLLTALRLAHGGGLTAVVTYDARLAAAARQHGLAVLEPS